jgi:hypothetical protein
MWYYQSYKEAARQTEDQVDDETAAKQYVGLMREMAVTYTVITSLLARLPIPMLLPAVQAAEPEWAVHALCRAWELAIEEPLPALEAGRVRDMITGWLTAYELALAADRMGPAVWRLRSMEAALLRARWCAYQVDKHLTRPWWQRLDVK